MNVNELMMTLGECGDPHPEPIEHPVPGCECVCHLAAAAERLVEIAKPTIGAARTLVNAEDAWIRGWTDFTPFEGLNEKNASVCDMAATNLRTMIKAWDAAISTYDRRAGEARPSTQEPLGGQREDADGLPAQSAGSSGRDGSATSRTEVSGVSEPLVAPLHVTEGPLPPHDLELYDNGGRVIARWDGDLLDELDTRAQMTANLNAVAVAFNAWHQVDMVCWAGHPHVVAGLLAKASLTNHRLYWHDHSTAGGNIVCTGPFVLLAESRTSVFGEAIPSTQEPLAPAGASKPSSSSSPETP